MTELEKLKAGLPRDFADPAVNALKESAVTVCQTLNGITYWFTTSTKRPSALCLAARVKTPTSCPSSTATTAKTSIAETGS